MQKLGEAITQQQPISTLRTPRTARRAKNPKHCKFQSTDQTDLRTKSPTFGQVHDKVYTFYIDIQRPEITQLPKVIVTAASDYNVSQAVIKALEKFNSELSVFGIELPLDIVHYCPRLSKKNGKPKRDIPSLDYNQNIAQTGVQFVSIDIKDQELLSRLSSSQVTTETNFNSQPKSITVDIQLNKREQEIQPQERKEKKGGICFSSVC